MIEIYFMQHFTGCFVTWHKNKIFSGEKNRSFVSDDRSRCECRIVDPNHQWRN